MKYYATCTTVALVLLAALCHAEEERNLATLKRCHILNRNHKHKCKTARQSDHDHKFSSTHSFIETGGGLKSDGLQIQGRQLKQGQDYIIPRDISGGGNTEELTENIENGNTNQGHYVSGQGSNKQTDIRSGAHENNGNTEGHFQGVVLRNQPENASDNPKVLEDLVRETEKGNKERLKQFLKVNNLQDESESGQSTYEGLELANNQGSKPEEVHLVKYSSTKVNRPLKKQKYSSQYSKVPKPIQYEVVTSQVQHQSPGLNKHVSSSHMGVKMYGDKGSYKVSVLHNARPSKLSGHTNQDLQGHQTPVYVEHEVSRPSQLFGNTNQNLQEHQTPEYEEHEVSRPSKLPGLSNQNLQGHQTPEYVEYEVSRPSKLSGHTNQDLQEHQSPQYVEHVVSGPSKVKDQRNNNPQRYVTQETPTYDNYQVSRPSNVQDHSHYSFKDYFTQNSPNIEESLELSRPSGGEGQEIPNNGQESYTKFAKIPKDMQLFIEKYQASRNPPASGQKTNTQKVQQFVKHTSSRPPQEHGQDSDDESYTIDGQSKNGKNTQGNQFEDDSPNLRNFADDFGGQSYSFHSNYGSYGINHGNLVGIGASTLSDHSPHSRSQVGQPHSQLGHSHSQIGQYEKTHSQLGHAHSQMNFNSYSGNSPINHVGTSENHQIRHTFLNEYNQRDLKNSQMGHSQHSKTSSGYVEESVNEGKMPDEQLISRLAENRQVGLLKSMLTSQGTGAIIDLSGYGRGQSYVQGRENHFSGEHFNSDNQVLKNYADKEYGNSANLYNNFQIFRNNGRDIQSQDLSDYNGQIRAGNSKIQNFAQDSKIKEKGVKIIKVPYKVKVPVVKHVHYPVHIKVTKPYPVPYPVYKEIRIPKPVPVYITKNVPLHVSKPYPVHVPKEIKIEVPHYTPVKTYKIVKVPLPKPVFISKPLYIKLENHDFNGDAKQ